MIDLDRMFADLGIGPEPEPPAAPPTFIASAERHRAAMLGKLHVAKASLETLISLVELHPEKDDHFASVARSLGTLLSEAGAEAALFHGRIECVGEA